MKTYVQEYECGCWYLFNVDDMHNWKLRDFTLCDECADKFTSWWVSPQNSALKVKKKPDRESVRSVEEGRRMTGEIAK